MRALVFSGGGARVHYHAGAVHYLLGQQREQYSMYCGVSAGSIAAAFLSQYSVGEEELAAMHLGVAIRRLKAEHVMGRWQPFGKLHGLWKPSFYTTRPLRELIKKTIDVQRVADSDKQLWIGAVALGTGQFTAFSKGTCENLHAALAASMAFPGFLEPVKMSDALYVDGGVRVMTPLGIAIKAGATEVDVVMASPAEPESYKESSPNALQIAARSIELMANEILEKDLKLAMAYNQVALDSAALCKLEPGSKRFVRIRVIRPQEHLGISTFDFDSPKLSALRTRGYKDAAAVTSVVK